MNVMLPDTPSTSQDCAVRSRAVTGALTVSICSSSNCSARERGISTVRSFLGSQKCQSSIEACNTG